MSNLDEAFTKPTDNYNGTIKKFSFANLIVDLIIKLINSCNIEDRYTMKLNKKDYYDFIKESFYKHGIKQNFENKVVNILTSKYSLSVIRLVKNNKSIKHCVYYRISNEYDNIIIAIGAYKIPVWKFEDENILTF